MTPPNQALLTAQHRSMEAGIEGLVDGSGSRAELANAIQLLRRHIQAGDWIPACARMTHDELDRTFHKPCGACAAWSATHLRASTPFALSA